MCVYISIHIYVYIWGFPGGSDSKVSACNEGDMGSTPGSGRSLEKEMETHTRILVWKNPMDGGAWWSIAHGVAKNQTQLSGFTFTFHIYIYIHTHTHKDIFHTCIYAHRG